MRLYGAALAAILIAAPALSVAAPQAYGLEKNHVDVDFVISHLGFTMKRGQFNDVDGTLTLDEAAPANSKVDITVKTASIDTNHAKRDQDLSGPMFFDVAKYPEMHFVSTSVKLTGKDTADVTGNLTLHGVTKPLVLHTKLNKLDINPLDRKKTAGLSATGHLKRSEFEVKGFLPMIGDDVDIVIEAEFNQPAPPRPPGAPAGPGGPPPAR